MRIPNLPSQAELIPFKRAVRSEFVSASRRGEEAFQYIMAVEKAGTKLEDFLQVSAPWTSIEAKLAAGVTRSLKSRPLVGRKVALRIDEAAREDRMLPGRALLFLVYREYRQDDAVATLYDLEDLMEVKLQSGDSGLASFWEAWNNVELGLSEPIDEKTKQHLLWRQVGTVPCLQTRLINYMNAKKGGDVKTYEHLRQVIDAYLDEELMKKNRDSTRRQLQTGHSKMLLTGNSSTEHAPALSASPARRPNSKHRQNASSAARIDDAPAAVAKSKGKGKQRTRSPSPNKLTPEASKLAREQKVCYQYVLGVCSKGDDCKYSHGELDGLTGPATTPREQNPQSAAEK